MTIKVQKGAFYEFHRTRAVNRPAAEIHLRQGVEVGPEIPEPLARRQVLSGRDVYTPFRSDAYRLACAAYGEAPKWDGAHEDEYFPHYHPGDKHNEKWKREASEGRPISGNAPGHVYWGTRGELKGEKQDRNN